MAPKGNTLPGYNKMPMPTGKNRDAFRNITYRDYSVACPTGDIQSYEDNSVVTFCRFVRQAINIKASLLCRYKAYL